MLFTKTDTSTRRGFGEKLGSSEDFDPLEYVVGRGGQYWSPSTPPRAGHTVLFSNLLLAVLRTWRHGRVVAVVTLAAMWTDGRSTERSVGNSQKKTRFYKTGRVELKHQTPPAREMRQSHSETGTG